MQLDTHVKGLLDTLAASGQPKMWELPPTEARKIALGLRQMVEGEGADRRARKRITAGAVRATALPHLEL